jgi:hypothetical protein
VEDDQTASPARVFISGQKLDVSGIIERELLHRSAIEAVIGHLKPRQSRLDIARPRPALL